MEVDGHPQLSLREWISVLKLASLWCFSELRKRAIQEISRCTTSPVQRISLAQEYHVRSWLLLGREELVADRIILPEEAMTIGWDKAFHLASIIIQHTGGKVPRAPSPT